MKKFVLMGSVFLMALVAMTSCNKDNYNEPKPVEGNVFADAVPTGYYNYAEISVPAATDKVYIKYQYQDGSYKTIEQAVTPEVTIPTDGKDVEPFGTVKLLFQSETAAMVKSVYYKTGVATKADGDEEEDAYYALEDLPVNLATSGEFGKTRYVQVQWNFAWKNSEATNWQNTPTYPKDVVFYDATHNHTLRYTYAYSGVGGEGYMLTDAYEVVDHVATATKYNYCGGCGNCQYCMPWGCSCGCGGWVGNTPVLKANPNFTPNGDLTAEAADDPNSVVADPSTPGETSMGDGGTLTVDQDGTIHVDYAPADAESIYLNEPAPYTTTVEDEEGNIQFTMYHSSGVVMFDDRFPAQPDVDYLYDYNDMVIDYDIEALTVADEYLEAEGWREKVKATIHVRALGGNANDPAIGVGLILENFNTENVDYIVESKTLDSGGHGELPTWTKTTLQENSLHYDITEQAGKYASTSNPLRPAMEVGRLQALNSVDGKSTGGLNSGNEVYYYKNGELEVPHVFNPARKKYADWGGAHTDQYEDGLADLYTKYSRKLSDIQNMQLYNTIPGYLNVSGGLYTYTIEYYIKPRADMTPEESAACKANMMETVMNTNNQNFYMVKANHTPVGLKGYEPLEVAVKDYAKGYKARYEEVLKSNTDKIDEGTYFKAKNGMVWGFKCPVLTRHTWELMPFAEAYPHYKEWVESNGAVHSDWYKKDVNTAALVCEW